MITLTTDIGIYYELDNPTERTDRGGLGSLYWIDGDKYAIALLCQLLTKVSKQGFHVDYQLQTMEIKLHNSKHPNRCYAKLNYNAAKALFQLISELSQK